MGRQYKLPFILRLERKYNDINIEDFLEDWKETESERQERKINMHNDLHIELNKFETYNLKLHQILDLAMRYAFSKREFKRLCAQLIELKQENKI